MQHNRANFLSFHATLKAAFYLEPTHIKTIKTSFLLQVCMFEHVVIVRSPNCSVTAMYLLSRPRGGFFLLPSVA